MKNCILIIMLYFSTTIFGQNTQPVQLNNSNQIQVDFSVVIKQNVAGASGANVCWLLDSDKFRPRKRSMESALSDLKIGALRFPYGHLADNYLWTTPPFENAVNGLTAKVASKSLAPYGWDWCVNPDGTYKNSLDFDEFVTLCKKIGAEPLIMVNVLGFRYPDGPSLDYLIQSAAEWVKYSNITRKYNVKYWQLGNEVEHTKKVTMEDYVDIYGRMASAMKKIDPTICVGTGVLGQTKWNDAVLEKHADKVSFISTHQYSYGQSFAIKGYEGYKEAPWIQLKNVQNMQDLLNQNPAYKNINIMITETGATGAKWPEGRNNDLYRSLFWFEMNMEELSKPNVKYSFFWGTHSPWSGEKQDTGLEYLFTIKENITTPTGRVVELINNYMPKQLVKVEQDSKYIRAFAGISPDKKTASVFILNKNDKPEKFSLKMEGINIDKYLFEKIVYTGNVPTDMNPEIKSIGKSKLKNKIINTELAPFSITVLNFKLK